MPFPGPLGLAISPNGVLALVRAFLNFDLKQSYGHPAIFTLPYSTQSLAAEELGRLLARSIQKRRTFADILITTSGKTASKAKMYGKSQDFNVTILQFSEHKPSAQRGEKRKSYYRERQSRNLGF